MTSEQSPVQQFYCGSTVLITGGSGFLGKVLLEKLLRDCPQLHQIVLLLRPKKGVESWQRLENLLDNYIFKGLPQNVSKKVTVVAGDCQLPDLGLSTFDRQQLVDTVDIVFHVAASIKFDEDLASAVVTNVVGTKTMLDLARDMVKLKAFVYVSTAFSNCDQNHIDEKFYPSKYDPMKLMRLTEAVDEPYLSQLTPLLLDRVPNTYIYTKAAAEELVRTNSRSLPVSVFRPSIVISTRSEPVAGWTDNLYGAAGLLVATVTGVMRTLYCDELKTADVVPVDLVVNALIVTAWSTHARSKEIGADTEPQVFNFVSSPESPLQWKQFLAYCMSHNLPSVHTLWYPWLWMTRYKALHRVLHVVLHLLPAYVVDTTAHLFGISVSLLKITRRIEKMANLMGYFVTREWSFSNRNTQQLWLSLSPQDRQLFPFSFADFDWDSYFKSYMLGVRQYLLKDDLSNLPRALTKLKRLSWMNTALLGSLVFMVFRVISYLFNLTSSSPQLAPHAFLCL